MKGSEPSERIWLALKKNASAEKGTISYRKAIIQVRKIALREGAGQLPDEAVRFYAYEYLRMVKDRT